MYSTFQFTSIKILIVVANLFSYMHSDMIELLKDMKKEEIREDEFLQQINGLIG